MSACVLFVMLTAFTGVCLAGDVCYNPTDEFFYCEWGCCDTGPNQQSCCSFKVWIIVLSVIGGISLIAVVICVVCMCVCQKRARARAGGGRVIQAYATQQPVISHPGNAYGMTTQGQANQGFTTVAPPPYSTGKAKY